MLPTYRCFCSDLPYTYVQLLCILVDKLMKYILCGLVFPAFGLGMVSPYRWFPAIGLVCFQKPIQHPEVYRVIFSRSQLKKTTLFYLSNNFQYSHSHYFYCVPPQQLTTDHRSSSSPPALYCFAFASYKSNKSKLHH